MPPHKKVKQSTSQYINNIVNKNYFVMMLNNVDTQISLNLREANIMTRPASSNGLWCCTLLPTVLILYTILCTTSPMYRLVAYISVSLLFYSLLYIMFMSVSCLVLQEQMYGGCVASSLVSSLLIYVMLGKDLSSSLLYSLLSVYIFSILLRYTLLKLPKTFSIGEAMLAVQGIVLYAVMTVAKVLDDHVDEEMDFVVGIVNTVLTTVGMIVTALYLLNDEDQHINIVHSLFVCEALFAVIMLYTMFSVNFLLRAFYYIFMDAVRLKLFAFWLALLLISVGILTLRTQLGVKATTVTRKSFHILASVVFLSGVVCDETMMMLAAGCGLGLLVLVEALRKSEIAPISTMLHSAFQVYSDEKDVGVFAMTPLYLYCGLACPLVLTPSGRKLELLSGVLSVGVGDTAASWFGARYGRNKWTGSNKSVEGTTFNILTQIATVYALVFCGLLDTKHAIIRTAFAATVSGLTEALTDQVDNLVLPLVTIIAFQITWPFC